MRVYYLSWLRNKILHNDPEVEKKQGWTTVGDMEGCGHYRVGERRSLQGGPGCRTEPRSQRLGDGDWRSVTRLCPPPAPSEIRAH